jgi:hypothetical protein
MDGASFLRDVVKFMASRDEKSNQGKTVKQLIDDFMEETSPDPNLYNEHGRSCLGFKTGLPPSIIEALNSGDGVYRP